MGIFKGNTIWDGEIVEKRKRFSGPLPSGGPVHIGGGTQGSITAPGYTAYPTVPGLDLFEIKLRKGGRTSRWILVQEAYYLLPYGTYLDLNRGLPPYEPLSPATAPRRAGYLHCTVARLMASPDISNEERSLWLILSQRIQQSLEGRLGTDTLIIGGNHKRKYCPDPNKYWGTITVAVTFKEAAENRASFIAQFDRTRSGNLLLVRVNEGATFEAPVDLAITHTIGLAISALGILKRVGMFFIGTAVDEQPSFAVRVSAWPVAWPLPSGPEGRQRLRRSRVGPEDPFCESG